MACHSGAVVVMVMMMMVSWSNCMMSNTSVTSTTAGNSTAAASSAWCNGHIIHGQCMLVTEAAYRSGGEHLDLNLDVVDMAVVEYHDLGESSRRVLVMPGLDISQKALKPGQPVVKDKAHKYGSPVGTRQKCGQFTRRCRS